MSSLRARVLRGIAWKAGGSLGRQLLRIVVTVLLARLLSPHDYGVAGMVLVFAALVEIFGDIALGAAIVQRERLDDVDRSTAFWISVGAGILFTILGLILARPLAAFYDAPQVAPLFRAMSLSFLLTALGSTQTALLLREMDFRSLELRLSGAALAGAGAAVAIALSGGGPWALIGQQVVAAGIGTMLVWRASSWRPSFVVSLATARSLGGFSGRVLGTRLLFYANRNADNLLIGRVLGASALGAYTIAYNVMLMPSNQVAAPVQEVLYPAFSRMQHDARRVADAWLSVNRMVGAITLPALAGIVVVAPDFVSVLLGSKWHDAVAVIQILAWVGMLQSLQSLNSSVLQARNRTQDLLRYAVVVTTASLIAFVVGLQWGLVGVAVAYAVSSTLVEPYYTYLAAHSLGISVLRLPAALLGVMGATVVMAGALVPLRLALVGAGIGAAPRLALLVLAGVCVYVPTVVWAAPELRRTLASVRRRPAVPAAAV